MAIKRRKKRRKKRSRRPSSEPSSLIIKPRIAIVWYLFPGIFLLVTSVGYFKLGPVSPGDFLMLMIPVLLFFLGVPLFDYVHRTLEIGQTKMKATRILSRKSKEYSFSELDGFYYVEVNHDAYLSINKNGKSVLRLPGKVHNIEKIKRLIEDRGVHYFGIKPKSKYAERMTTLARYVGYFTIPLFLLLQLIKAFKN